MIVIDFEDDPETDEEEQELDVSSVYLSKPPRWFLEGHQGPVHDFIRLYPRKGH